ncbi:GAF domain-containing protein [Solimonas terrae]|uniref:GAF domain-containing protein n=1 Tax=Solimonas terrae TaxID=1396819 RepID=A0A6M2BTI8_9GAMM|nr:GAF domain-containing protein [Solimonas terrae]NGY05778.1 GAF domain-containing protein [Solimonas terrae]
MSLDLDTARDCLDSAIPCTIATVSGDGIPNVTYVSHAEYVDAEHLALSFQFFNKTRENVLARRAALLYATDSESGASYRLELEYLRTESEGPLFERMKARLAGIASHTGMAGVFRLRGADVYRVRGIEAVAGISAAPRPPQRKPLAALRAASCAIAACGGGFDALLDAALDALQRHFDIHHAALLMLDRAQGRLYLVGSRGYARSGIGSEIELGDGVIGVAAAQNTPIRIAYATSDYRYVHVATQADGADAQRRTEIPFPGLAHVESQLAVPIVCGGEVRGVLYVECPQQRRFGYDDEDALITLSTQLGLALDQAQAAQDEAGDVELATETAECPAGSDGTPLQVRRYREDDSIFLDDDYLIKGVAGAILWKLLDVWLAEGRNEFSNRELRLDPSLRLPDIADNLEARLVLLSRRLAERSDCLRIEKTARGRFRLHVGRPVRLAEIGKPVAA